jgi:hypothetical protein
METNLLVVRFGELNKRDCCTAGLTLRIRSETFMVLPPLNAKKACHLKATGLLVKMIRFFVQIEISVRSGNVDVPECMLDQPPSSIVV